MKNIMNALANRTKLAMVKATLCVRDFAKKLHEDESGVEIVVIIIILAILVSIAAVFREKITGFVNKLFDDILAF